MPMTLNDITVPFEIMADPRSGTFRGKMDSSGREDTLTFQVAFSDLNTFLKDIKGKPTGYGDGESATITRTEPLKYPYSDGMYAISATYRAVGSDDNVSRSRPWADCFVDVTFGALQWFPNDPSQPFVSARIRGATRIMTQPGVKYTFAGTGERREQDIGFRVAGHTVEAQVHDIPNLSAFTAKAIPLEGSVNNAALTVDGITYQAGYLLFETFAAQWVANGLGARKAEASIVLQYSSLPWNYDIRVADNVVDALVPAIYPAADLSVLFRS